MEEEKAEQGKGGRSEEPDAGLVAVDVFLKDSNTKLRGNGEQVRVGE
jgi:hypothetical protein